MKQYIGRIHPHSDFQKGGRYYNLTWLIGDEHYFYGDVCTKCGKPLGVHGGGDKCPTSDIHLNAYYTVNLFNLNKNIKIL